MLRASLVHADWERCKTFVVQKELPCEADTTVSHMAHVSNIGALNWAASVSFDTRTPHRTQHKCFQQTFEFSQKGGEKKDTLCIRSGGRARSQ